MPNILQKIPTPLLFLLIGDVMSGFSDFILTTLLLTYVLKEQGFVQLVSIIGLFTYIWNALNIFLGMLVDKFTGKITLTLSTISRLLTAIILLLLISTPNYAVIMYIIFSLLRSLYLISFRAVTPILCLTHSYNLKKFNSIEGTSFSLIRMIGLITLSTLLLAGYHDIITPIIILPFIIGTTFLILPTIKLPNQNYTTSPYKSWHTLTILKEKTFLKFLITISTANISTLTLAIFLPLFLTYNTIKPELLGIIQAFYYAGLSLGALLTTKIRTIPTYKNTLKLLSKIFLLYSLTYSILIFKIGLIPLIILVFFSQILTNITTIYNITTIQSSTNEKTLGTALGILGLTALPAMFFVSGIGTYLASQNLAYLPIIGLLASLTTSIIALLTSNTKTT